jgi:hypothetical protein
VLGILATACELSSKPHLIFMGDFMGDFCAAWWLTYPSEKYESQLG